MVVLENPDGSFLFEFPAIKKAMASVGVAASCVTYLSGWGPMAIPKPVKLIGPRGAVPSQSKCRSVVHDHVCSG